MEPLIPTTGLGVLHLFCKANQSFDAEKLVEVIDKKNLSDVQVISVSILGHKACLLYTSPSPRDRTRSRMPSSA